jgi:hypothetical protein
MILAIDPGTTASSWMAFDGHRVVDLEDGAPNQSLLCRIGTIGVPVVSEDIESYGMPVGAEVFVTARWIGRFEQRCADLGIPFVLVKRSDVKLHLCGSRRAKDANIHQALLDRFGPGKSTAVGIKKSPGPLYGVRGHCWSALAVAVTYCDSCPNAASAPDPVS